ncbi:ATP-binding protein [Parageobacillus thermoglucosidasius]|uniref:ATP-binding protein n=1 Tax=Parageobacillus thermoglucosidasius TaxID=1426 RepID=A0AAN1D577_PARTM|nr:ATP-binding protein [Parageobacillus thermoglucosidasius]ALF08791.1 ATP-binding protein [Parageobacillus thermoglucosidasius]ANZ28874.1 ATP-binding protein [Parageobacillus thermoglucosidasius]APM79611.1 ATP-binding protein [Parageobacillus thermoglucosidasius]KJX68450.1 ATP-binding protein [Parageobacillus thermoglucosidasius]RDE26733.1 ATP-binding protein [Parageobacillus thermoglucosidasius]
MEKHCRLAVAITGSGKGIGKYLLSLMTQPPGAFVDKIPIMPPPGILRGVLPLRRLIDKFKDVDKKSGFLAPSLPTDLSYSELSFMTKRGFLGKKLSQYLGCNKDEGDFLFYLSLSKPSFTNPDSENKGECILYLSELMLKWSEQKQDIPYQIKRLDVRPDIQNAMLKAYDMFKDELFSSSDAAEEQEIDACCCGGQWEVYRDVMFAATQGKFLLLTEEEVSKYKEGIVLCEGRVKDRSDIPICRNLAKEKLESEGLSQPTIMRWLLVLSEAITNAIKHAEEGTMTILKDEKNNEIRFVIEDKGPGFALKDLPKKTLLAGYSTKKSLGQGFTLMMTIAKRVLLFTSPKGSVLILSFDIHKKNRDQLGNAG